MDSEALPFVAIMAGVAIGTAVLLFGESSSNDVLILAGGVLALLSVGGLTGAIARA